MQLFIILFQIVREDLFRKLVEVSQLGCRGSGNRLQKQKLGPWGLGERKAKVTLLERSKEEGTGKAWAGSPELIFINLSFLFVFYNKDKE